MNTYPKLIIFSDKAIPRVKSTYKGASVTTYNLKKLDVEVDDPVSMLLSLSKLFSEFKCSRATVISGYTENHYTYFCLSNTEFPTLKLRTQDQVISVKKMLEVAYMLAEKYEYLEDYASYAGEVFDALHEFPLPNQNKLIEQDLELISKSFDNMTEFHESIHAHFLSMFEADIPNKL